MDSDRATAIMDEIVSAGWRVSLDQRVIRRYAVAAVVLLGAIAVGASQLVAGASPAQAAAGLAAPAVAAVLVAAAFRAAVLELAGDVHRAPPDARDVVRRAITRAPEVLAVSWRAARRRDARSSLAAPVVVVNGVGADEAARTSEALVAHCWGPGTVVTSGLLFSALFVLPIAVVDALVAVAWSSLGFARVAVLVLAVAGSILGLVAALALDGAMRGALLRVARGDRSALPPAIVRLVVLPEAAASAKRAYRQAFGLLVLAVVAIAMLPRAASVWFVAGIVVPAVAAALVMLRRAYRRPRAA